MVKNTKGGKHKHIKKSGPRIFPSLDEVQAKFKDGIDYYGEITGCLEGLTFKVKINTGAEIRGILPGRHRKRMWLRAGDLVHVKFDGYKAYEIETKLRGGKNDDIEEPDSIDDDLSSSDKEETAPIEKVSKVPIQQPPIESDDDIDIDKI